MATPCPSEVDLLKRRGGALYSDGHQAMYRGPVGIIAGKPAEILDVGCGIGYGLELMLQAGCVGEYVGLEPDDACISHIYREVLKGSRSDVQLLNLGLTEFNHHGDPFDFVFCIEVIEHVEEADVPAFIARLRHLTGKTLFLSTPCSTKSTHGAYTEAQMREWLTERGFDVVAIPWQWTTLYICSPRVTE